MIVRVENSEVVWDGARARCAVGRAGVVPEADKREGDGATPAGRYPFRRVFYRPDRERPPLSGLTVIALREDDGWCDDPADPAYNRPVRLPYPASAEQMWREDGLYDIVVVIGHNDDPPVPGMGSAIFVHCANIDADGNYATTAGCVALAKDDLRALVHALQSGDEIEIV
jgi:L,D-peptidoglycan transpeptidase YkuD (ErfK/YbiS/YcfS/YnhG family)